MTKHKWVRYNDLPTDTEGWICSDCGLIADRWEVEDFCNIHPVHEKRELSQEDIIQQQDYADWLRMKNNPNSREELRYAWSISRPPVPPKKYYLNKEPDPQRYARHYGWSECGVKVS